MGSVSFSFSRNCFVKQLRRTLSVFLSISMKLNLFMNERMSFVFLASNPVVCSMSSSLCHRPSLSASRSLSVSRLCIKVPSAA